jgi:hypothetical protein
MTSAASSSRARALAAFAALAMLLGGCKGYVKHGTPFTTPPPQDYGSKLKFTPISKPPSAAKTGTLVLTLAAEDDGRAIQGAYVDYRGPQKGHVVTNARGLAVMKLRPGTYKISVPHCGESVLIDDVAEADAIIVAGQKQRGSLNSVTWERRYRPTASVVASARAPWDRNERVTLGVRVEDGCSFTQEPNRTLSAFGWHLSGNFGASVSTPRSDGSGYARITVACTARGDGEVTIYDRSAPDDEINLLDSLSAPKDGGPFCR